MDTQILTKRQPRHQWQRVTKRNPCPICGKADNCTTAPAAGLVYCGRIEAGSIRQNKGGQYLHRLDGDARQVLYTHPGHAEPRPKSTIDFAKLAADAAVGADQQLDDLAAYLGVSVASLRDLGIGWHIQPSEAWTVPERDATGSVIGIQRRLAGSHKKRAVTGSRRGLVFGDWKVMGHDGPLLLVEGASDTAACITLGLAAIGRPSNVGGVEHLAKLLKETDRQIIVVGENDQKADGRNPGRSGAISTAEQLAERLQRPIAWTLPPDGENDTRSWLQSRNVEPSDAEAAGRYYLNCLLDGTTTIKPPPAKPVVEIEPYTEPAGQVVKLDAWWKEMAAARIESLGKPGLYCDSSPTGAGKSFADQQAMIAGGTSITLVPTHANGDERVDELAKVGIVAVAYPEHTKDNCKNFDEATAARDAGLSMSAAVCSRCEHRYSCDFKRDAERAKQAPHAIACHQRARRFIKLATGKKYIAVHENAEDLLRPTETFRLDDLGSVTDAVAQIRDVISGNACDHSAEQTEMKDFFSSMLNIAESMRQQLSKATTTKAVSMPLAFGSKPKHVEQKLWWAVRKETHSQDKYGKLKEATQPANAAAMRTLIALATGELNQLVVQVDSVRKKKGGELKTVKRFVATWQTEIPNKPVWFSDATQTAEYLAHLAGRPVEDKTPGGRLARLAYVTQIPRDITRATTNEKVASWLRGILAANPNAKDIGLIGHQHHVVELTSDKSTLLDKRSKAKISRWAYFGQGIDRASNGWHDDCDLLIVLGTPRIGDMGIRQRLIRAGQVEAAAADGDWGDRCWEGRTTEGEPVTVKARSYQNPAWHAEYERQTHAALIQAVGRARPVLASGVKVVCVTTANIGLPVAAAEATSTISAKVQAAAAAVESERKDSLKDSIKENLSFKPGVSTKAVAEKLGVSPQRASQLLAEAADVGLVERLPGKRAGWTPAEVAEQDAERAAIQAESAEFEAVVELPAIESVDWPPSRPPWLPAMPERLPAAAPPPLELAVPG